MSRSPRIEIANGVYHVVARGNERRPVLWDDVDRTWFLEVLASVAARYRWRVLRRRGGGQVILVPRVAGREMQPASWG